MGIPGLTRHLEPYATHYSPESLKGYSAIIDGPAIAYHAHKLALAASAGQSRMPCYADIIAQSVCWLNDLEIVNIKVSAIFFDGALPSGKQTERLSRMAQTNKAVKQLRDNYPTAACPIPTFLGSKQYAFLAPALREALAGSNFAPRTRVVPGEADDHCASHARSIERSIIFTSDTDLFLFNYPSETLVVFLQDAADPLVGLRAYSPERIRRKLELKSLILFAFAIIQEPSYTTTSLIRMAQNLDLATEDCVTFSQRYITETAEPIYTSNSSVLSFQIQALDVRVSEFAHQALQKAEDIFVYLPVLAEDPNQASAWAMGQDIRTLAYSLLAPRDTVIHEHKRKAQGIAVHEIYRYSNKNKQVSVAELNVRISAFKTWCNSKEMSLELFWALFSLSLMLGEMTAPPLVSMMLRVLNGEFDNTWNFIQLTACLQAVLYSLRILKQTLSVWLAIHEASGHKLLEGLAAVNEHFATFPSIAAMFTVLGQKPRILAGHDELKSLVEEMYTFAGVDIPAEPVPNKKARKKAGEAERKKRMAETNKQTKQPDSNAFSLLGT